MNQNETIPILFQKIQTMSEEIKKLNDEIILLKKENEKIKQLNDEIIELKKSQIKPNSNDFKFKFKSGINYSLNENQTIATKIKGGNAWNCTIIGDTEIPKNKISKWKIRLNEFRMNSGNTWDVIIGIGPDNPNNEMFFIIIVGLLFVEFQKFVLKVAKKHIIIIIEEN